MLTLIRHSRFRALPLLFVLALILSQAGCSQDNPVLPEANQTVTAPTLPDPQTFSVDLGFFADGKSADKSQSHFFNAYLRAVIVSAMTELVLAPPVAAFAVALHTPPTRQDDGSWIWVYTHVDGADEFQIRLRGEDLGTQVAWSLRVSTNDPQYPLDKALWFDGYTAQEGTEGFWTFYDPNLDGEPAAAELAWGADERGNFLRLLCLLGEDAGDQLTYLSDGPRQAIEFNEADSADTWFIRWDEFDGSGRLQVPDYNYGRVSCWDTRQQDTDCGE